MAELILARSEVETIQKYLQLENLEIVLRPDWGSQNPNYRESLHGELKKRMAKAYPFSDSSISHCPTMGGFAFTMFDSNHVLQIGFDIEEDSRVRVETARRICHIAAEYEAAPSPASLWTAKEAAYKCLKGSKQPAILSHVEVTNWQTVSSQYETVEIKNAHQFNYTRIQGIVVKKQPYTLTFFIARA
ncbi:MAG: 4'-phosphopantetheinyl transferase superfamily protein [Pseudobdellovibrionaceae bacterium]